MVYRVYVEKKESVSVESKELYRHLRDNVGLKNIEKVRILNRYDVEGIDEALFEKCVNTIFSEPQVDIVFRNIDDQIGDDTFVIAVSALPGQFDQRADSAAQCIQIVSQKERPNVKYAAIYIVEGKLNK